MSIVQAIRTVLFYLLLSSSAFVWGTLSLLIAPFLPFRARYRFIAQAWCKFAVWLAGVMVGVRYELKGARTGEHPGPALRDPRQAPEHLGDLLPHRLLRAAQPGTQARVAVRALLRLGHGPAQAHRHQPQQAEAGPQADRQTGRRAPQAGRLGADLPGRHPRPHGADRQILPRRRRPGGQRQPAGSADRAQRRALLAQKRLGEVPRHHPGGDRPGHVCRGRGRTRHRRAKPARRSLGCADPARDAPPPPPPPPPPRPQQPRRETTTEPPASCRPMPRRRQLPKPPDAHADKRKGPEGPFLFAFRFPEPSDVQVRHRQGVALR